ncbi:MAG TPA: DEAD/DEAH box helicase [Spirochaetota bacterium]|nr:DEAD/DEAH box helicase [Spirochaetota bacterium]HPI90769.1 DEAD/DEAH box helicase [Spirochaetota bacterium]HPR48497.1 DEAD/DEAH box helicase [Spirochaetota bacterium]
MTRKKFDELGLSQSSLNEIAKKGFEEPTEIQEKIIPLLLNTEKDLIGQAQTGTGKTAAFGLPILEKLKAGMSRVQCLILVPTRELALQVSEEINSLRGNKNIQVLPVYGGQSIPDQIRRLKNGVDIVVGTPGRILDHLDRGSLDLGGVSFAVLDEADEMLSMGFIEDIEKILSLTNPGRRTALFSATMPEHIMKIARNYMKEYEIVSVKKDTLTVEQTDQIYFEVSPQDKFESLCRIIDIESEFYGLIFCRTKVSVDELTGKLIDRGYEAESIHGDFSQHQRERCLEKFRKRRANILVATDVAARGIDISDLTHVINYSLPQDPEAYVHRIGRTGRAGKKGVAVTFISPSEFRKLSAISRATRSDIRKERVPSVSDILDARKDRLAAELDRLIKKGLRRDFIETAVVMLSGNDPLDIVAALLQHSFREELDAEAYNEISEVLPEKKGTTRLFVSLGKKDGLTPKKLVKLIQNGSKVSAGKISEITVKDSYSFLTVPFAEAETILRDFKNTERNKAPLIHPASREKEKNTDRKKKKAQGRAVATGSHSGKDQKKKGPHNQGHAKIKKQYGKKTGKK